jgi:hypothetical protein
MTLLIAVLLLNQIGADGFAYFWTIVLWLIHVAYHEAPSASKIVEKLRERK